MTGLVVILKRRNLLPCSSATENFQLWSVICEGQPTSDEEHLRILLDSLFTATPCQCLPYPRHIPDQVNYGTHLHRVVVLLIAHDINCLLDIPQYEIAVRIIRLPRQLPPKTARSYRIDQRESSGPHTCSLPRNSRSPRSLTKTCSSSDRRTRSRGSWIGLLSSASDMLLLCVVVFWVCFGG